MLPRDTDEREQIANPDKRKKDSNPTHSWETQNLTGKGKEQGCVHVPVLVDASCGRHGLGGFASEEQRRPCRATSSAIAAPQRTLSWTCASPPRTSSPASAAPPCAGRPRAARRRRSAVAAVRATTAPARTRTRWRQKRRDGKGMGRKCVELGCRDVGLVGKRR